MKSKMCKKSGHEVAWDGRTVWVNSGKTSASLARFSHVGAEVHLDVEDQVRTGEACLDCFKDTTLKGWKRFQASVLKHYGAIVPDGVRPNYLRS